MERAVTMIHCADLHLTAAEEERAYGLAVFEEIIGLCEREQADVLLIAGDLFDSFRDLESLSDAVRRAAEALPSSCTMVVIAGNHELLGLGKNSLHGRAWGRIRFVPPTVDSPLETLTVGEGALELLLIPYRDSLDGYMDWEVPAKRTPWRVVAAHGSVPGLVFLGPEQEADGAAIDADLFVHLQADYGALGHIHLGGEIPDRGGDGTVPLVYPGSARVWRRGESGPRCVRKVTFGSSSVAAEPIRLVSAGEYRLVEVPLTLEGEIPTPERLGSGAWNHADWIELHLTGVVDRADLLAGQIRRLQERLRGSVRRVEVDQGDVVVLEGVSSQPLAVRFLEAWRRREPASGDELQRRVWLKARERGLLAIKQRVEAQS